MFGILAVFTCILLALHDPCCGASALHYSAPSNLTCFLCNSVDQDGESCLDLSPNRTHTYFHECAPDETFCTIVRVRYAKDNPRDSTPRDPVAWSVERNCTKDCLNGCITMGERTKLHMCRYCCKDNYCNMNTDHGLASVIPSTVVILLGVFASSRIFIPICMTQL